MNCNEALGRMMDAEIGHLAPHGTNALAMHLATCARCATVASALRGETRRLAQVMSPSAAGAATRLRERRERRPYAAWGSGMMLAASALLWIAFGAPVVSWTPSGTGQVVPVVPGVIAPSASEQSDATAPPRVSRTPPLVRVVPSSRTVAVVVNAVEVKPVSDEADVIAPAIQIEPEPGTRATVMGTRNPNITVVWLTK